MARLSPNPDRNFSAGYEKRDPEIDRLLAEPPLPWDDILDDPVIRQRVGKLIGDAMDRLKKSDFHLCGAHASRLMPSTCTINSSPRDLHLCTGTSPQPFSCVRHLKLGWNPSSVALRICMLANRFGVLPRRTVGRGLRQPATSSARAAPLFERATCRRRW